VTKKERRKKIPQSFDSERLPTSACRQTEEKRGKKRKEYEKKKRTGEKNICRCDYELLAPRNKGTRGKKARQAK